MTYSDSRKDFYRERDRERERNGYKLAQRARKLKRGGRIMPNTVHHAAMAVLVAELLGPRPDGHVLSLVNPRSKRAYLGWKRTRSGERRPYVLSTDPNDYRWETREENDARGNPTRDELLMAELRRREVEGGRGMTPAALSA